MAMPQFVLLMRALILTTLAITTATNVALIVALVRRDCTLAELMGLPNTILVLFGILFIDVIMYLAFELLWLERRKVDEEICSQVLLETSHDYRVGNKKNQILHPTYTNHVLDELEDNIKTMGSGLDKVLRSECETSSQDKVMAVDKERFDTTEKPLSKIYQDHLGQTIDKKASVSETVNVEHTKSFGCHGSFFLSEQEDNTSNLTLPYGQDPTSKVHSTNNTLGMINRLAVEGFANGELVRDAVSIALSEEVAKWESARCNKINETLKFNNEGASSMCFGQARESFFAHFQFAEILDDFWGNLFDMHGKLTEKAKIIRLDLLIGLDVEDNIQRSPCHFDRTCIGLCDCLFRTDNSICPQHGNCVLPKVVELRRNIMDTFLKENSSLLRDEKVYYFVISNDQVQDEALAHENFLGAAQPFGMVSNWVPCQLEELNPMAILVQKCPSQRVAQKASQTNVCFSYNELKGLLLYSLRACIQDISYLDKSDWLIQHKGGYDERLINVAFEMEIFGDISTEGGLSPYTIIDSDGRMFNICTLVMGCGDSCIWQPSLLINFGVWCISRIFEVLISVRQPMVLEKYSRVLNRLQGILDLAFLNPVKPVSKCKCAPRDWTGRRTSVEDVLKRMLEIKAATYYVHGEGKKNLKFVLKRYKRRLSKVASMAELK
ncbi:hypothetical protein ACP4OV_006224 [Aristida adscensionis]